MVIMPIDMPNNCWDCPCHAEFAFCNLMIDTGDGDDKEYEYDYNLKCIPEGRDLRKNRRENCPLIEMHTHKPMSMTEEEIKEMREYLIKGDWGLSVE